MPKDLIENVDLSNATLDIRKRYDVVIDAAANSLSATVNAGSNETFLSFDEDRYILMRADGNFEPLTDEPSFLGGPGIRYFRKINRVTARNGAGASTWDFQLLMNPEFDGMIPMFGASRKF